MILIYKRQMTIFEAYPPFAPSTQGFPGKILLCGGEGKQRRFGQQKSPA